MSLRRRGIGGQKTGPLNPALRYAPGQKVATGKEQSQRAHYRALRWKDWWLKGRLKQSRQICLVAGEKIYEEMKTTSSTNSFSCYLGPGGQAASSRQIWRR
jgi:hypothetical protein